MWHLCWMQSKIHNKSLLISILLFSNKKKYKWALNKLNQIHCLWCTVHVQSICLVPFSEKCANDFLPSDLILLIIADTFHAKLAFRRLCLTSAKSYETWIEVEEWIFNDQTECICRYLLDWKLFLSIFGKMTWDLLASEDHLK